MAETDPRSPLGRRAFSMRIEPRGQTVVIRAFGDLDLTWANTFEAELRKALAKERSTVVLDLGEVGFIDPAGVHALLVMALEAGLDGDRLRIRRDLSPAVKRAFETDGVEGRLPFLE